MARWVWFDTLATKVCQKGRKGEKFPILRSSLSAAPVDAMTWAAGPFGKCGGGNPAS